MQGLCSNGNTTENEGVQIPLVTLAERLALGEKSPYIVPIANLLCGDRPDNVEILSNGQNTHRRNCSQQAMCNGRSLSETLAPLPKRLQ